MNHSYDDNFTDEMYHHDACAVITALAKRAFGDFQVKVSYWPSHVSSVRGLVDTKVIISLYNSVSETYVDIFEGDEDDCDRWLRNG